MDFRLTTPNALTQERLIRLLDNPELLSVISYEELKTLALAYPYAHNLRYLLALKAREEDHPEAERMLATAAAYSLDRRHLYALVAPKQLAPQPVAIAFEEAVLELKPVETLQRELLALAPRPRQNPADQNVALDLSPPPAEPQREMPEAAEKETGVAADEAPEQDDASPEQPEVEATPPQFPYQPFAVWFSRFEPPVLQRQETRTADEGAGAETTETPATAGLTAQELAERSVAENRDVISETLAKLLARQGYRDKAINMYERLRLAIPEKSAYFAAEIEKLKK